MSESKGGGGGRCSESLPLLALLGSAWLYSALHCSPPRRLHDVPEMSVASTWNAPNAVPFLSPMSTPCSGTLCIKRFALIFIDAIIRDRVPRLD